jgi:hypothetical protein
MYPFSPRTRSIGVKLVNEFQEMANVLGFYILNAKRADVRSQRLFF